MQMTGDEDAAFSDVSEREPARDALTVAPIETTGGGESDGLTVVPPGLEEAVPPAQQAAAPAPASSSAPPRGLSPPPGLGTPPGRGSDQQAAAASTDTQNDQASSSSAAADVDDAVISQPPGVSPPPGLGAPPVEDAKNGRGSDHQAASPEPEDAEGGHAAPDGADSSAASGSAAVDTTMAQPHSDGKDVGPVHGSDRLWTVSVLSMLRHRCTGFTCASLILLAC